jgi:hypothetical protein
MKHRKEEQECSWLREVRVSVDWEDDECCGLGQRRGVVELDTS